MSGRVLRPAPRPRYTRAIPTSSLTSGVILRAAALQLVQVASAEQALPITRMRYFAVAQAVETEIGQGGIDAVGVLGQARDTETARPIVPVKTRVVGQAVETGTAFRLRGVPVGRVVDTETAQTVTKTSGPTVRQLGALTVSSVAILRLTGLVHADGVGEPTIRGRLTAAPIGLAHVRDQGIPQLSARVPLTALTRTRALGAVEVNLRVLVPGGLSRE